MPAPLRAAVPAMLLTAFLAGCAAQPKPKPVVIPPASRPVSAKERTANDQDFYRAVTAYVQGDYGAADELLAGILRRDPSNKDALGLRRRVTAAEKLSRR